ncbi:prepilin-type N-terminal cleavage/methylation domain-containing protein [Planctomycetota bacterium]|nr:prepilin-type N-terminal cleavage/methylation domain-containing protein [Planctomycetota bacterium]
MRKVREYGFTLMELLVVISIISLLIGILLPALSMARTAARGAACSSNMRQILLTNVMFMNDYKGRLPANRIGLQNDVHVTWRAWLAKKGYLENEEAWLCPAPPPTDAMTEEGRTIGGSQCVSDPQSNYALNGELMWEMRNSDQPTGDVLAEQIKRSSDVVMLLETRSYWPDLRYNSVDGRGTVPGEDDGGGYFSYWHASNGGYWGMFDGHVEFMKLAEVAEEVCHWHDGNEPRGYHSDWVGRMASIYK